MGDKRYPEFRLDSFDLVNFIFRHWLVFLITGVLAFIISVIVSLSLTPKYRSDTVLFPASNITTSDSRLFGNEPVNLSFGDEEATEKVLQILQSDEIRDYLIKKYDLFNHYEIPEDTKYRYTKVSEMMQSNITFKKTRFMSVQISVLDTDPEVAALIANDISAKIDSSLNKMIREASGRYMEVLQKELEIQEGLIESLEDSISLISLIDGSVLRLSAGDLRSEKVGEYGPVLVRLSESHEMAVEDMGLIRQKLTEARLAASRDLPYTMVINKARVAEKKDWPHRSVIVIISTFSTLLFLCFVLVVLEGISWTSGKKD